MMSGQVKCLHCGEEIRKFGDDLPWVHGGGNTPYDSQCALFATPPDSATPAAAPDAGVERPESESAQIVIAILTLIGLEANFTLKWNCHTKLWTLAIGWFGITETDKSLLTVLNAAIERKVHE